MKILSIGNSFSQDAHNMLHIIAKQNGMNFQTVNLYIGGCSLESHHSNLKNNSNDYFLERNGGEGERNISITEAFELDDWDIVTLQQASALSGIYDSYLPHVSVLADAVRTALPKAELYFHQTWSYETDSSHDGFLNYGCDQKKMFDSIKSASIKAAELINAKIIPAGETIQNLREKIAEFDYQNGGLSLCRDGFHLSLDYGRYAAAVTWYYTFTGEKPKVHSIGNMNFELMQKIVDSL